MKSKVNPRVLFVSSLITLTLTTPAVFADTIYPTVDLRVLSFTPTATDTGTLSLYNVGSNIQRSFFQFDLSAYSGKSVTSNATLTLTAGIFGNFLTGVSIGTANSAWSPVGATPITWTNQPAITPITDATNPSGTFGSGPVTWTIPGYMIEKMATPGSGYNNGLGITSGAGSTQHFFSSAEAGTSNDPKLTLTSATAASGTWTGGNGSWTDTTKWAGSTVAEGIGQTATINGSTAINITMDANRSVGSLAFSGADHTISAGAGKLALNVVSGSPTISVEAMRTATIGATLVGVDGLTKNGSGRLTLTNSNTYRGQTIVNQGTLALGNDYDNTQKNDALGTSTVLVTGGAQLRLGGAGGGSVVQYLTSNAITLDNGTIYSNDGLQRFFGGITVAAGGGAMFVQWGGKNLSIESALTGSGTLTINGNGAVLIDQGGTIGGLTGGGSASIRSTQTLTVGSNNTNTTFSGVIYNSGSLTKTGTGTLTLSGANSYSGATTVDQGTLAVNGNLSSVTGGVSVNGILAGSGGTISGNTTINAGGKLAVGNGTANSIGTQTFNGTLSFAPTSIFEWNLNSPTSAGATANQGSYDKVVNNNGTKMSGTSVFNVVLGSGSSYSDTFWNTDKTWTDVFSGTGLATNLSTVFTSFSGPGIVDTAGVGLVAGRGQFSYNGTNTLTWSAVPEPTSSLAGLLITAGLLRRRRA